MKHIKQTIKKERNKAWGNESLKGTFVGTANGTLPASFIGGDPNISLPITMWLQYTFDGKGGIEPAFGEAVIGGKPSGLIKAKGTYKIDPETGIGMETIHFPDGGSLNRRISLSSDKTHLHCITVDTGFQFNTTMFKQ